VSWLRDYDTNISFDLDKIGVRIIKAFAQKIFGFCDQNHKINTFVGGLFKVG
jgi:hypothetical protein